MDHNIETSSPALDSIKSEIRDLDNMSVASTTDNVSVISSTDYQREPVPTETLELGLKDAKIGKWSAKNRRHRRNLKARKAAAGSALGSSVSSMTSGMVMDNSGHDSQSLGIHSRTLGVKPGVRDEHQEHSPEKSGGSKRKASHFTPPKETLEKKRKLFRDVAVKALRARILMKDPAKGELTVDLFNTIVKQIYRLLDSMPSGDRIPTFYGSGFSDGKGWIHSSDQFSWDWLQGALTKIGETWGFGELQMDGWNVKVPLKRGTMIIPSQPSEEVTKDLVLNRLQRSNPGLDTSKWRIYSITSPNPNIRLCVMAVDLPSIETLKALDFELFYLLGRASIRISGK